MLFIFSCGSDEKESENYNEPYDPNSPLVVNAIGPEKGGLGTRVVVSGLNFGNDTSKIKLYFNEKEALILKAQSNALYAMVPKQPGDSSIIKVAIKEGENSDGTPKYREAILEDKKFKYNVRATVTTVAGQYNVEKAVDGPALEATFARPVMLSVDKNGQNILISDDNGKSIRHLSLKDNKVSTVVSDMNSPWQNSYNYKFDKFFVVERGTALRPHLFTGIYEKDNWQEPEKFYDQKDASNNYIARNMGYYGLASDDEYVFLLSAYGSRFVRVHHETRKVELIGENLDFDSWSHITMNKKNGMIYVSAEGRGRIYRFDPYYTPPGHTTPWITQKEIEHIVGTGKGNAKEGNGTAAQLGDIEGITSDWDGNVYVADYHNHIIWKIDEEFNATIFAGVPGTSGYQDGKPKEALFFKPYDVAATPDGILYVADTFNRVIRCVAIQ